MTCIVGIADGGAVWIGGDSAGVDERFNLVIRSDPKVFRVGEIVMGFTTSFRMGQLLRYRLKAPEIPPEMDVAEYMATVFIDAVRECLKDGGFAEKTADRERGGTFLVGIRGRLFKIEDDYQVGESVRGFEACGGGDQVALGSLFTTRSIGDDVRRRITTALESAAAMTAVVQGPFVIVSTEDNAGVRATAALRSPERLSARA